MKKKYYLLLLLICIAFFIYKWNHLFLPYTWDELGVYSKGTLEIVDKNLSLIPNPKTSDIVRGHPTLFFFIYKHFFNLFGTSVFHGHLLSLIISIILALSTWYVAFREKVFKTNKSQLLFAFTSLIMLLFQPMFDVQSAMVLPEMLLALFMFWSFYFLYKQKLAGYIIVSTCAILTKETALIIPGVVLAYGILRFSKIAYKQKKFYLISFLYPLLIFIGYFSLQYIYSGYFFYPYHIKLINWSIGSMFMKFISVFYFLFISQGRFIWLIMFIWWISFKKNRKLLLSHNGLLISVLIVVVTFGFFLLNYSMARYLLYLLPVLCILFASLITYLYERNKLKKLLLIVSIHLICCISLHFTFFQFIQTVDRDYTCFSRIELNKKGVNYLLSIIYPNETIGGNFPIIGAFEDPRQGWIKNKLPNQLIYDNPTVPDYYLYCKFNEKSYQELNDKGPNKERYKGIKVWKEKNMSLYLYKKVAENQ